MISVEFVWVDSVGIVGVLLGLLGLFGLIVGCCFVRVYLLVFVGALSELGSSLGVLRRSSLYSLYNWVAPL